jgi:hypothetical protein
MVERHCVLCEVQDETEETVPYSPYVKAEAEEIFEHRTSWTANVESILKLLVNTEKSYILR